MYQAVAGEHWDAAGEHPSAVSRRQGADCHATCHIFTVQSCDALTQRATATGLLPGTSWMSATCSGARRKTLTIFGGNSKVDLGSNAAPRGSGLRLQLSKFWTTAAARGMSYVPRIRNLRRGPHVPRGYGAVCKTLAGLARSPR
jgi:hypothetical protein